MITFKHKGNFRKTERFLTKAGNGDYLAGLHKYAQEGVEALQKATPKDTGVTANSWSYRIIKTKEGVTIEWDNANVQKHANIALIIQLGHGTGSGAYVKGVDYINPALAPIFDKIAGKAWEEVTADADH